MQDQIRAGIEAALQGDRKITITFKDEALGDLRELIGMDQSGAIRIPKPDLVVLGLIYGTGAWQKGTNRTVTIELTEAFDEDHFVQCMSPALQTICVGR